MPRKRRRSSRRRRKRKIIDWLLLIGLALVCAGLLLPPPIGRDLLGLGAQDGWRLEPPAFIDPRSPLERLGSTPAKDTLLELEVRNSQEKDIPPYDRHRFGERWADTDRNGCDTRNDVLARDLARVRVKEGTNSCVVISGTLADPYTGRVTEFRRGPHTSELVQIDHVVALADAWRSGAWSWDDKTRLRFANDPQNLRAVDGKTNEDKGASAADAWMPPNVRFHCEYALTQIRVKHEWQMSVTPEEQQALAEALLTCPDE